MEFASVRNQCASRVRVQGAWTRNLLDSAANLLTLRLRDSATSADKLRIMFHYRPVSRRDMLKMSVLGLAAEPVLARLTWASRAKSFQEPQRIIHRGSDDQLLD